MVIRLFHVRRLERYGRLFFDRLHPSPVLHFGGPLLRYRPAAGLSAHHDQQETVRHAGGCLVFSSSRIFPPYIHGMVYDTGQSRVSRSSSGYVHF